MDFNKVIFKKKTFSDLLSEIYENSRSKEKKISELIDQLKPMINAAGDAILLVPLLKEYLEISVKNDEHLIKMAGIIQRAMNSSSSDETGNVGLSDKEKDDLFKELHKIKDVQKN